MSKADAHLRFMSYDNVCKFLAEQYPTAFIQWLLAIDAPAIELLKTELSQEPIRADSLVFLKAANQILHLEFQTLPDSDPPLPLRMLDYSVRLKRQYGCAVEQVVIFLKQTASALTYIDRYEDAATIHRYRVIRLWEQDSNLFLASSALLPFAALTQTDAPLNLLREVANQVARIENKQQRNNLVGCIEVLAGLRFEKAQIHQLFREDIMRESVIYQDIIEQGLQQGLEQGLQQGLEQGLQQGLQTTIALLLRQLTRKIGLVESALQTQIQTLSPQQLEALGEALLDFSQPEDLANWLAQTAN